MPFALYDATMHNAIATSCDAIRAKRVYAPKDVRARCESWTREEVNDQRRQESSELQECLNGSLGPRTYCNCRTDRAVLAGRHELYRSPVAGLSGGFDRWVLWRRFAGSDGSS